MPCHLSGKGRSDFAMSVMRSARTDSSPVLVRNKTPSAPTMSPTSQVLNSSYASPSASRCRKIWIAPLTSSSFAKLALPMTRFARMRPATLTRSASVSKNSALLLSYAVKRSAASALRRNWFG